MSRFARRAFRSPALQWLSAVAQGWAEQPVIWMAPETYQRLGVSMPETWLLYGAWTLFPPISIYDKPSTRRG